jgi:arsenate reductase
MWILYGISSCDSVKKAQTWLTQHQIDYQFYDYRKLGLSLELLTEFENELGWETLLNKRSTTWRQISDEQKQDLNREYAMELMLENPTLIKRPLLRTHQKLVIGFTAIDYARLLPRTHDNLNS